MGGMSNEFKTTYWSMLEGIHEKSDQRDYSVVNYLLKHYWKPVYCYLRCRGISNEQAKDLTQGFFHEVVIQKNLIKQADHSKGRFRTFLLTALKHYQINEYKKENAKKRRPDQNLVSWDSVQQMDLPQFVSQMTPEDAFSYAWVSDFLEEVLHEVEQQFRQEDKEVYWQLFHDRILQPAMQGNDPPPLAILCERYHIENPSKASNLMVTVKRRLQKVLRERIRNMVISDDEVEEELRDIQAFLPRLAQS